MSCCCNCNGKNKSMSSLTMPYAENGHNLLGKIWLSPPCKVNGGLSRFSDEFW